MENKKNPHYKIYFSLDNKEEKVLFCYNQGDNEEDLPLLIRWLLKDNRFKESKTIDKFYPIWISVHSALQILKGQSSREDEDDIFDQGLLLADEKIPIIHLTMSDLFVDTLFGNAPLPTDVPRSYMIMDNSIWNYLVPMSETYYIHNFVEYNKQSVNSDDTVKKHLSVSQDCIANFYESVRSICKNYKKNLYRLKVAQEYADLNARLTKHSYLKGAHASGVSPFIFHSEIAAKQLIQREFRLKEDSTIFPYDMHAKYEKGSLMEKICKHKWRILLLDDKAIEPMEATSSDSEKDRSYGGWNCKKSIICNLLESQFCLKDKVAFRPAKRKTGKGDQPLEESVAKMPDKNTVVLIEYAQNLDEAREVLKDKKYDLILIDYLLNEKTGTHYGYELFEDIWNDQEQHKNGEDYLVYKTIRPHHHLRMYCMFISAYSSAVHDRLLAEGLNQSEKYWYINLGACPTNTPQLFLYNLIKLMDKRLEDAHIGRLSIKGIVEILEKIYEARSIRKSAGEYYEKIQSCQYFYRNLLQDYDISVGEDDIFEARKSVLITHFLNHQINMGGLLEHIAQLIHLTAFGTVRQWPEMWEEYLYAKAQMEAQLGNNDDLESRFKLLCNKMEGYILKLKSSAL